MHIEHVDVVEFLVEALLDFFAHVDDHIEELNVLEVKQFLDIRNLVFERVLPLHFIDEHRMDLNTQEIIDQSHEGR